MAQYKLVKWYPSLHKYLKDGSIVSQIGDKFGNYFIENTTVSIPKDEVENNPEFWQEVKTPLFTTLDGVDVFEGYDYCVYDFGELKGTNSEIHKVNRASQTHTGDGVNRLYFSTREKAEEWVKKISLKTVDGKELSFGDVFFTVDTERFKVYEGSVGITFQKERWTKNAYSTRELAKEWIQLNEPKYSVKDMVEVVNNWSMIGIDEKDILNFFRRKNKL